MNGYKIYFKIGKLFVAKYEDSYWFIGWNKKNYYKELFRKNV